MIRPVSPAARKRATAAAVPNDGASVDGAALESVEGELIAIFADLTVALGLPRSFGQIYGLAYASMAPICFDDVVSKLGLSKGSASQGIRVLRELGALHPRSDRRTVEPSDSASSTAANGGARREYLVPETSVRALLGAIMRQRVQPPLDSGAQRLAQLHGALGGKRKAISGKRHKAYSLPLASSPLPEQRAEHLLQRIQSLETWHKKARGFLPILLKLSG